MGILKSQFEFYEFIHRDAIISMIIKYYWVILCPLFQNIKKFKTKFSFSFFFIFTDNVVFLQLYSCRRKTKLPNLCSLEILRNIRVDFQWTFFKANVYFGNIYIVMAAEPMINEYWCTILIALLESIRGIKEIFFCCYCLLLL